LEIAAAIPTLPPPRLRRAEISLKARQNKNRENDAQYHYPGGPNYMVKVGHAGIANSIAVLNGAGKLVMESIVETKASTLLDFLHGLHGELHATLEEGTWAAWLYDVLKPHVLEVVVCNPRRNALLKEGSKSDKVDARKLAELLRSGMLRAVYHGENGLRALRDEFARLNWPTSLI
jgi:hypothetical protein